MAKKKRADRPRSYRLDRETLELIDRLRAELRDPDTGRPRTSTDILRQAVRMMARNLLMETT
jgi:hypothetical protein